MPQPLIPTLFGWGVLRLQLRQLGAGEEVVNVQAEGLFELTFRLGAVPLAEKPEADLVVGLGLAERFGRFHAELGEEVDRGGAIERGGPGLQQAVETGRRLAFIAQFAMGQSAVVAGFCQFLTGREGLPECRLGLVRLTESLEGQPTQILDLRIPGTTVARPPRLESLRILQGRVEVFEGVGVATPFQVAFGSQEQRIDVAVVGSELAFPAAEVAGGQELQRPITAADNHVERDLPQVRVDPLSDRLMVCLQQGQTFLGIDAGQMVEVIQFGVEPRVVWIAGNRLFLTRNRLGIVAMEPGVGRGQVPVDGRELVVERTRPLPGRERGGRLNIVEDVAEVIGRLGRRWGSVP